MGNGGSTVHGAKFNHRSLGLWRILITYSAGANTCHCLRFVVRLVGLDWLLEVGR